MGEKAWWVYQALRNNCKNWSWRGYLIVKNCPDLYRLYYPGLNLFSDYCSWEDARASAEAEERKMER